MIVPSHINYLFSSKFRKLYLFRGGCIPHFSTTPGSIDTKPMVKMSTDGSPLTSIKISRQHDHSFPFKLLLFFKIWQIIQPLAGCILCIPTAPGPIDTNQRVKTSTDGSLLTSINITRLYHKSFLSKLPRFSQFSQIVPPPGGIYSSYLNNPWAH